MSEDIVKAVAIETDLEERSHITEEMNVQDIDQSLVNKLKYLPDDMLVDDPINTEVYGELEVNELAEDMKQYGFQGVILAYPYQGKYRIESGHRRRYAGRKAGIKEYPVFVTDPPSAEWERALRLGRANLHSRNRTPMIIAKETQFLYEAHEEEQKAKKEAGCEYEKSIIQLVAQDLEISTSQVSKYKALLNLIPELQKLADDGISWSTLSSASNMTKYAQEMLYRRINGRLKLYNKDGVTRSWLEKEISELKYVREERGYQFDRNDIALYPEQEKKRKEKIESKPQRVRRRNGTKAILKNAKELCDVLDGDAIYKIAEIPVVIKSLEDLQKSIQKKLEHLKYDDYE